MTTLYMKVTKDKYELPIAVAESPRELAEMLGTTRQNVLSCISKKLPTWKRIYIDDEEDDDGAQGREQQKGKVSQGLQGEPAQKVAGTAAGL